MLALRTPVSTVGLGACAFYGYRQNDMLAGSQGAARAITVALRLMTAHNITRVVVVMMITAAGYRDLTRINVPLGPCQGHYPALGGAPPNLNLH